MDIELGNSIGHKWVLKLVCFYFQNNMRELGLLHILLVVAGVNSDK